MDKRVIKYLGVVMLVVFAFGFGTFVGRTFTGFGFSFLDDPRVQKVNFLGDITGTNENAKDLNFDMYWQVWEIMKDRYVDVSQVDQEKMFYSSIKGMVNSFDDPATIFLDPEETKTYNEGNSGNYFSGIGAELGYRDGRVVVISPIDGSPAKAAGIKAGDIIMSVDGQEVKTSDTLFDVVGRIRGESGTKVKLGIISRGNTETKDIEITRAPIDVPSMVTRDVEGQAGVKLVDVSRFTEGTLDEWKNVWDAQVEEVIASGATGVILDLRGNPGGYLDAAVYAAEEFLPKDTVVLKQSNREGKEIVSKVSRDGRLQDIKVVVLVNEGSASASEILAGALSQNNRAEIVGVSTYGKGTAQSIVPLQDNASLHITVFKWLLPDGTWINKDNKIEPDHKVEISDEQFKAGQDPQLDKAVELVK